MSAEEKILQGILDDAKKQADEILTAAEKECREIEEKAAADKELSAAKLTAEIEKLKVELANAETLKKLERNIFANSAILRILLKNLKIMLKKSVSFFMILSLK